MTPVIFWGSEVCSIIKFLWAYAKREEIRGNEQKFLFDLIRWAGHNSYAYALRFKKILIKKAEVMYPFPWDDEKRSKKPSMDDVDWDILKGMQDKSKR